MYKKTGNSAARLYEDVQAQSQDHGIKRSRILEVVENANTHKSITHYLEILKRYRQKYISS